MTKPLGPQSTIIDDDATRAARGPVYLAGFEDGLSMMYAGAWTREVFCETGLRVNLVETPETFLMRYRRQQATQR